MRHSIKSYWLLAVLIFGTAEASKANTAAPVTLSFAGIQDWDYPRDRQFSLSSAEEITAAEHIFSDQNLHDLQIKAERNLIAGGDIYDIGIEGLGVKLFVNGQAINSANGIFQRFSQTEQVKVQAKLVAYKPLAAQSYQLPETKLATIQFGQEPDVTPIILLPMQFRVTQRTCEITEKNIRVELLPVFITDLAGQGTEAGSKAFNIALNCQHQIQAHITLTDQNDQTNHSTTLTLDQNRSSAQGVGIRLYRDFGDHQAVTFGQEWLFSSNETQPTRQFIAKYVNVAGNISAGNVNAVATIMFSYR